MESATSIAEIICRYAIFEDVYLQSPSRAADELQRALVNLYTSIMIYLSKANSYFEQNSASKFQVLTIECMLIRFIERILKSSLLAMSDIDSYFDAIGTAQETVDRCSNMVGMQGRPIWRNIYFDILLLTNSEHINQHIDLKRLLKCIDGPIQRLSVDFEIIKDGFECKLLVQIREPQLISLSVEADANSTVDIS